MAAPVDICNLALSHLGDDATVASIAPPDQSIQATLCARFYPIARDSLLESHAWGFATKRVILAQINSTVPATPAWQYAYPVPSDSLSALAVQDANSSSDFVTIPGANPAQNFVIEAITVDGSEILYINQSNAMLRYVSFVQDSERLSPLFVEALALLLASKLAGPLIKGQEGRAVAAALREEALMMQQQAAISDSNDRRIQQADTVSWMDPR